MARLREADWAALIMAGGEGTRMGCLSRGVSKHLLPVHDKPMIYYPLSLAIQCGCRQVLLVVNPQDELNFRRLLASGRCHGVRITYLQQEHPRGAADGLRLAADCWGSASRLLVLLGDNLVFDLDFHIRLRATAEQSGAVCALTWVPDVSPYGCAVLDERGDIVRLEEKPVQPGPGWAVAGIYVFDRYVSRLAPSLRPSTRGELEMLDVLSAYHARRRLSWVRIEEGCWMDAGTVQSLNAASRRVADLQSTGSAFGSPEAAAVMAGLMWPESLETALRGSTEEYRQLVRNALGSRLGQSIK